ncbi:excinuclease ABC subunit UvrA [Salinibacter ruber]|uniref:UvrABC system protein A n=1 Tax=Salinibacter ruber TaxID=146919 RepID=A0A9X2U729_9BACT|nr:excinuclease ABC subunit UvrA [Salinibacter ruber]MCS3655399.1 excinuclease ABC subunit A [Salinibacter ruber]MCS3951076.1 excinuclease ABC subunit A [Salinibacter ruber]MCS4116558.1 excinuclease ABC subunit A [Salinibacter ruber]MCS4153023.1 excinuclease ABC subunit A [Salinibacter ruber]MCS4168837.1 excinuclease ABC subunit A [Salinibacter ruber]
MATTERLPTQDPVIANASVTARESAQDHIVIRGARQHNLKDIDLDLPRNELIVFTGPSGSGKSSLCFDTIYAEGQRRYVESLSAYARQFLERMDKPEADLITGLAPAIAIEQKTSGKNPRSTVATQTEIYDHLRLLFARIGTTYSPVSGEPVSRDTPHDVADRLDDALDDGTRFYLCAPIPEHADMALRDQLTSLRERGFYRILRLPTERQAEKGQEPEILDLNQEAPSSVNHYGRARLRVLIDRLKVKTGDADTRSRIAESVEQAFDEGDGYCTVIPAPRGGYDETAHPDASQHQGPIPLFEFSAHFERDGMRFEEPTPQLFSFNSPVGACPTCQGFGRVPGLDEDLIVPNKQLSIRDGALAPFRGDKWGKHFKDLIAVAADVGLDIDCPYHELADWEEEIVWEGKDDYIGLHGFFEFLEENSYKRHYRIFRARFRGYSECPDCSGYRLCDDALYVKVGGDAVEQKHIGEICAMTTRAARDYFEALALTDYEQEVAGRVMEELRERSRYLVDVGLDYLTLDRLAQTLSGGETQRINLSTSLGSSLVGSLYVLDEPTVGLHPRDNERLIDILQRLRDLGNTVLVVEHDPVTMEAADQLVDLGPASGAFGGEVVFQGPYDEILEAEDSLTGQYLSGRKEVPVPDERRPADPDDTLVIENARQHNLKHVDVEIPLGQIVCVTGVSGSGKSTLTNQTLYEGLHRRKGGSGDGKVGAHDTIRGHENVDAVEMVDQSSIGRSPRSNPATYTNAFDGIRKLFAQARQSQVHGYDRGTFSFNTKGGRCEECEGQGVVKVEMQFLADLYLECEACNGQRYKKEVLNVTYNGKNIADVLDMTVDEAADFFEGERAIINKLEVLQDIGLGYLTLGQPSTTLSGGEAQRIKLASHLSGRASDRTLYIFDEPTTGLHFDDIKQLLGAFEQLVDAGHSVIIIEHNLDVVKYADHVIDLGPEGGDAGGNVVATGTPEEVAACDESHTGRFLRDVL